jgi:hypothetical protein
MILTRGVTPVGVIPAETIFLSSSACTLHSELPLSHQQHAGKHQPLLEGLRHDLESTKGNFKTVSGDINMAIRLVDGFTRSSFCEGFALLSRNIAKVT